MDTRKSMKDKLARLDRKMAAVSKEKEEVQRKIEEEEFRAYTKQKLKNYIEKIMERKWNTLITGPARPTAFRPRCGRSNHSTKDCRAIRT